MTVASGGITSEPPIATMLGPSMTMTASGNGVFDTPSISRPQRIATGLSATATVGARKAIEAAIRMTATILLPVVMASMSGLPPDAVGVVRSG